MWAVAIDPAAGARAVRGAERALEAAGLPATVDAVPASDLGDFVRASVAGSHRQLAVCGGDADLGALCEAVLAAAAGSDVTVALVPMRRKRNSSLLRMFGLPHRGSPASHLAGDATYRIDVVEITTSTGTRVGVASAGAGTAAGPQGRLRRRGAAAEVTIETPSRTTSRRARGVLIANSQFWGAANPAPRAMLVDGRFDLQVLLGRRDRGLSSAMRRGRHTTRKDVLRMSTPAAAITPTPAWPAAVDGAPAGMTPLRAVTLPGAIRLKI